MTRIPKIIHYCWLSGEPMPERLAQCVESWRKMLPDYEFICWDAERFDIHSVKWVEQACSVRKWAFAADYIRLYALYNYGGIYLDSDVMVFKSLDPYLDHGAFSGVEFSRSAYELHQKEPDRASTGIEIEAAIMGAQKGHPIIGEFFQKYQGRVFIAPDGKMETTIMPVVLSSVVARHGFVRDYTIHQTLDNDFHIYPYDYFASDVDSELGRKISLNTVAVHLCSGSWVGAPRRHSPYTMLKRHTAKYFNSIYRDVIKRLF